MELLMAAFATYSPQSREELILSHLPQVRLIAKSYWQRCPLGTEIEDLVGVGTVGLIQAVDRFDASRGLKLKTLAEHRIRGAILDFLRAIDPLPRSVRKFAQRREQILSRSDHTSDETPSDSTVAGLMGLPLETYQELAICVYRSQVSNVPSPCYDIPDDIDMDAAIRQITLERLTRLLTPQEAETVRCLIDGLSHRQIADRLAISIATVSYLKWKATQRMREFLTTSVPTTGPLSAPSVAHRVSLRAVASGR
jgi:RNA polymerase sigma factor (sigma-70 family)